MVAQLDSRQLTAPVGEGGELSGLDKRLLEYAAMKMSPEQMSDELSGTIDAARCAQRVREILRSQDWLSIVEQQSILMLDMTELRNILFDRIREEGGFIERLGRDGEMIATDWVAGDPRWSANLIRLLKLFQDMLEKSKAEVEKSKSNIRQSHADLMMASINLAFERMVFEIEKEVHKIGQLAIPADDREGFEDGWRACLRAITPHLPTQLSMIEIMEHAIPKANEAIEAKVVEN